MSKLKCRIRNTLRDERGATLALVAVGIFVLLGMVALAVDVGMLLGRRTESQRVADAAALAGAASFITAPDNADRPRTWAIDYAGKNTVDKAVADVRPEDVDVLLDEFKVRVRVRNTAARGNAVQTIFARVLGWDEVDVVTVAAAEVVEAGAGVCPLPIALPDRWIDQPQNPDQRFDPDSDKYAPYNDGGGQCSVYNPCQPGDADGDDFTGFAGDDIAYNLGDVIEVKTQAGQPNKNQQSTYPVLEDGDPSSPVGQLEPYNSSPCVDSSGWSCWFIPSGQGGASSIAEWINGCPDRTPIPEGSDIDQHTGIIQSNVLNAMYELVENNGGGDPTDWYWDSTQECMASTPSGGDCMDVVNQEWFDARTRPIPVIDPRTSTTSSGSATIDHWECVFIEKVAETYYMNGNPSAGKTRNGWGPPGRWNVYVRFVRCSDGQAEGHDTGPTLKTLRLVE